ncbi:fumarylacetoacetate hydrolase family protein [Nocardioides sp. GXZ039]|uniref:fumarylacetoacetate hydrolase family protein n=1 Tax=Nocardioides sp. GXZ039 TaxID=3136018 RepID=UPI0030F3946D
MTDRSDIGNPFATWTWPWPAGKVAAVHLNYGSRIRERGVPAPLQPSFFLKPGTSLSGPGEVVRPDGLEQLTFEGEIAVVIGRRARGLGPDDAWSAVAAVTAANDLGLADLRPIDRGSNLRSKGGDGFTPIGPRLLDADDIDPGCLALRTWHNGRLVQDAEADDLLFSIPDVLAALCELITLEPGDVVLTGTPAGAGLAEPGDVVEVEVRDGGTERSTGRLVTVVKAGPPMRTVRVQRPEQPVPAVADPLPDGLDRVAAATLAAQLQRRGISSTIDGVTPLRPGTRLAGRARTLRFVALREDLVAEHGTGFTTHKQAFADLGPGEVLVIDARGEPGAGTLGDLLALCARSRGAAGVVTDGAVRDAAAVAEVGVPVFAGARHPATLGRRHVPWDRDVMVSCGGTAVEPGDLVVGDDDGVVVVPRRLAAEVVADAVAQEREEAFIAEQLARGESPEGLYPLGAAWRERYAAWTGPDDVEEQR